MANDKIVPVLEVVLQNDDTVSLLADYVTSGYPDGSQDTKLQGTHQTAAWIRQISKVESPFIGTGRSGEYLYDKIIQVDVFSQHSENYAVDLADDIESLLKATTTKTFYNVIYKFIINLHSRTSLYNDEIQAWQEMIRFRVQGLYS